MQTYRTISCAEEQLFYAETTAITGFGGLEPHRDRAAGSSACPGLSGRLELLRRPRAVPYRRARADGETASLDSLADPLLRTRLWGDARTYRDPKLSKPFLKPRDCATVSDTYRANATASICGAIAARESESKMPF